MADKPSKMFAVGGLVILLPTWLIAEVPVKRLMTTSLAVLGWGWAYAWP